MTEQKVNAVWHMCETAAGNEVVAAKLIQARYEFASCVPLMPRYWAPRNPNRRDASGVWSETPAIPNIVFTQLPANIDYRRFMEACSVRKIRTVNGQLSTVTDKEVNDIIERVGTGKYSSKLTRAAVYFLGLLGKTYTIPRGIFTGHKVKLVALVGKHIEFEIEIAGEKTMQKGPLTMLMGYDPGMPVEYFEFAGGVRLRLAQDEDNGPERLGPVDGSPVVMATARMPSEGGAPIFGTSEQSAIKEIANSPVGRGHTGMPQYVRPS